MSISMLVSSIVSSIADQGIALGVGLGFLAMGIGVGLGCIGAGIAVGRTGVAAIASAMEKPEMFTRSLIFVGLAEGIAIYGLIVSLLIWINLPSLV